MVNTMMKKLTPLVFVCLVISAGLVLDARQGGLVAAPNRRPTEGRGPFPTLTIRNVMVIDGTGAPPFGPMNVVVENNRIARITSAGRGVELAPQPFALREKERSAANAIVAPRLFNYQRPGAGWTEGLVDTPEKARA